MNATNDLTEIEVDALVYRGRVYFDAKDLVAALRKAGDTQRADEFEALQQKADKGLRRSR